MTKKNKSSNNLDIISEIRKLGKSFRGELKKTEKTLRREILRVEERVEGVEERVEGVEERVEGVEEGVKTLADGQRELHIKLSRIENTLDGFVGTVDNLRDENTAGADLTRELEVKVDGHEKRIKQLESPLV